MPRFFRSSRRVGPVPFVLMLWEVWRRMPKRQRRWVLSQARRHGPRIVRQVVAARRR
jgi:hypothetical protein